MSGIVLKLNEVVARQEYLRFRNPISWKLKSGEHWAVLGPNGGGKTLLIDTLLGKYALKSGEIVCQDLDGNEKSVFKLIKYVAFRDIYSIIDTGNSYYQQRWNKGDEQEVPLVKDLVLGVDDSWLDVLVDWFGVSELLEKEVNLLSSGELRKFLIIRSLLSKPKVLILDNPYIGLDAASRLTLNELLFKLADFENLQLILVLSNPHDVPELITHILPVSEKGLLPVVSREEFFSEEKHVNSLFPVRSLPKLPDSFERNEENIFDFTAAAILTNIKISYGQRTILNGLNWKIEKGDKWALLGVNGAGKSTLLSLICGDNPQAYANDIILFDRRRGSGESIWDIKKRIGYISPEMHLYYLKNIRCLDVVGSGFFDTVGLYRKCNAEQEKVALKWMEVFGVAHLQETSFLNVSSGEQRLVLLARVFVKNPDLLILDEPLHGLDSENKKLVKQVIEEFCSQGKTLIYVTHYENEIPKVVDKRLVLTKNK